jgi:L-aspartate oxidase
VRIRTDFLVIGSGIAGLRAAADLAALGDVTILTKADPEESNTGYAQGGIAAAVGSDDSPSLHGADTVAAGDGLCDEGAVRVLVEEGPRYVAELIEWGARFDRTVDGSLALGREGAHTVRRVLHAADRTGREIGRILWRRVSGQGRVTIRRHAHATCLDVRDGRCVGAMFRGRDAEGVVEAQATLLATGGAGQIYAETTNPSIATGDGIALAWRAGARVVDLEFVQFHPTVLNVPGAPRVLLSEALRGEGAWLVNQAGDRFMLRDEHATELASRDVVARAIEHEMRRTGAPVFLSLLHLDPGHVHERFPAASAACRNVGLDLARDRIPVGPAAHYMMGGVETDASGRATLPGLFAAGEVACTGVHGANRLASNSLLEGLVFGARAARAMGEAPASGRMANVRERADGSDRPGMGSTPRPVTEAAVRQLMWRRVGLERDRAGLEVAVGELQGWHRALDRTLESGPRPIGEERLASVVTVAALIARAALRREESRGGHSRTDFPRRDDVHWKVHIAERNPSC